MPLPVVFDLDGTLIDSLPGIARAANAVLGAHALPLLPDQTVGGFVGHGEGVFLDRLIAATDLDRTDIENIRAEFIAHYVAESAQTTLMPGASAMLATLKSGGVRIGLCTNKPSEPLQAVLTCDGLAEVFDVVVSGDTLPVRKPDPAPLRHAFEEMGQGVGIFVGDSEVDAETATRAGVPFVLFTEGIRSRPVSEIAHDCAISCLEDLPDVIKKLSRQKASR